MSKKKLESEIRLTSHTDYGLRVLIYVAAAPDKTARVEDIANAYQL